MRRSTSIALALTTTCMLAALTPRPAAIGGVQQAWAAASSSSPEPGSEPAQQFFARARELYAAGSYRAAIEQLEQALALDPQGAELVYNLGLVHEKLGDLDPAIAHYERYVAMIDDPQEAERVRAIIKRLEGARQELLAARASASASASAVPAPSARPPSSAVPAASSAPPRAAMAPAPTLSRRGKLDHWVIGSGALAGAALVTGVVFGIKALAGSPDDPATTTAGTSYEDLQNKADRAHRDAIIADIAFGTAIVAGASAAVLYLTRSDDSVHHGRERARLEPSVALLPGGAAAGLQVGF